MLEGLLKKRTEDIQKEADREKAEVKHFTEFINSNSQELSQALGVEDEEKLYQEVVSLVKTLEKDYVAPFGVQLWYSRPDNVPAVNLAWGRIISVSSEKDNPPYYLVLTDKGKEVIDAYRKAKGYIPLEEQRKRNRETHEEIIQARSFC